MSKKLLVALSLAALALASAPMLVGDEVKPVENPRYNGPGPATRTLAEPIATERAGQRQGNRTGVPVTVIYDDGIVTATPSISSYMFGNQFNTATGAAIKSFSVTMLSFYILPTAGSDNVFISVYGPVSGTTAPFIEDISVPLNNGAGMFNTATIGPYAGGGSFQAGVWYVAGDTGGLGAGTVNGQGHHGMAINDIVGTDWQTIGALNALVGASTAFIPVELMDFNVTDE